MAEQANKYKNDDGSDVFIWMKHSGHGGVNESTTLEAFDLVWHHKGWEKYEPTQAEIDAAAVRELNVQPDEPAKSGKAAK